MLRCLEIGITPVSILGTLVNAIVTLEINGRSGDVKILNRSLPDKAVNSALTSRKAFKAVWKRIVRPGGVDVGPRLVTIEATG